MSCEYLRDFWEKFEMVLMGYSEAGGKLIHKKTRIKKSRDTVPLSGSLFFFCVFEKMYCIIRKIIEVVFRLRPLIIGVILKVHKIEIFLASILKFVLFLY